MGQLSGITVSGIKEERGDEMADPTWRCIELHRDLRQCRVTGGDFGVQLQSSWWAGSQAPPLLASSISSVTEGERFNTAL